MTGMRIALIVIFGLAIGCAPAAEPAPAWEATNPIVPLPDSPLGIQNELADLKEPPTPERVRLGRWLFFAI